MAPLDHPPRTRRWEHRRRTGECNVLTDEPRPTRWDDMGYHGITWASMQRPWVPHACGLMIGNCSLTLPRLKEWLSNRPAAGAPEEGASWPRLGPVLAPTILANPTA